MPGDRRETVKEVITILERKYPVPKTALNYSNPLQILVATILSAQCTDKRVNAVTDKLFRRYHAARDYASADVEEFQEEIKSTGFYKNKARNIINTCKILAERYGGEVPDEMGELVKLPGVARKTANVVLQMGYGVVEGIVVDTHVMRLSGRLGLSKEKDPAKIEKDLMDIVPRGDWMSVSFILVFHGRETCTARKPKCGECVINKLCPSAFTF
ncbi:MAG: endonuclease III [Candidatus Altiarchaeales archaeon]|nr:endonuclease III [Candidatus Altiarchaeales archaeon]